jgi:cytochrome c oxidase cbb3-type subunit 2
MKNGALLFLGLFAALGASWAGIVVGSSDQFGALAPYYDAGSDQAYPNGLPGAAARGQLVYRDLNCASCHTQQVRRLGFGADEARGWGTRQSVARDYIFQPFPQLGESRQGPDLANFAATSAIAVSPAGVYELLYLGHGGMPAYAFLFEERKIVGEPSPRALHLGGILHAAAGDEIVPTPRAEELVAYLLSLNSSYNDYPEAKAPLAPKTEGAPAPAKAAAAASPATPAAPEAKK